MSRLQCRLATFHNAWASRAPRACAQTEHGGRHGTCAGGFPRHALSFPLSAAIAILKRGHDKKNNENKFIRIVWVTAAALCKLVPTRTSTNREKRRLRHELLDLHFASDALLCQQQKNQARTLFCICQHHAKRRRCRRGLNGRKKIGKGTGSHGCHFLFSSKCLPTFPTPHLGKKCKSLPSKTE